MKKVGEIQVWVEGGRILVSNKITQDPLRLTFSEYRRDGQIWIQLSEVQSLLGVKSCQTPFVKLHLIFGGQLQYISSIGKMPLIAEYAQQGVSSYRRIKIKPQNDVLLSYGSTKEGFFYTDKAHRRQPISAKGFVSLEAIMLLTFAHSLGGKTATLENNTVALRNHQGKIVCHDFFKAYAEATV